MKSSVASSAIYGPCYIAALTGLTIGLNGSMNEWMSGLGDVWELLVRMNRINWNGY